MIAEARGDGLTFDHQPTFDGDAPWAGGMGAAVQEAVGLGTDPGLGLLLELAQKGEYDPWNVDIVAVTDSYLSAMDERLDARDLSRVARLIFYAAALIHLKAKALAERQRHLDYEQALQQTLAEELELDLDEGGPLGSRLRDDDLPLAYPEDGPDGLLAPRDRPVRSRGLTLVDLIFALREYDDRLAQKELELADEPIFDAEIAIDECVGSSHQEDLDQDIVDVRLALWQSLAVDGGVDRVELASLVTERRSRAAAYLALLFLVQDEEVLLEQDVFYDQVWVVRGPYFGEIRAGVDAEEPPELEDGPEPELSAAGEEDDGEDEPATEEELEDGEEALEADELEADEGGER